MQVSELIDRVLDFYVRIDPNDADNLNNRKHALNHIQQRFDEVWYTREWSWKLDSDTVSVSAGVNTGVVPADFGTVGTDGGLYYNNARLTELPVRRVWDMYRTNYNGGVYFWSLGGVDTTTGRKLIVLNANGPATLTLYFQRRPPLLFDKPAAPTLGTTGTGITGTYLYKVAYTDGTYEGQLSNSATVSPSNQTVTLSGEIPPYNATAVKIYRTTNGGSTYKLAKTASITSYTAAWSTTDSTADGSLGADWSQPADGLYSIPEQYHQTVLIPGVAANVRMDLADGRNWFAQYQTGLSWMIANERPDISRIQKIPLLGRW